MAYSVFEIYLALYQNSLALLSDGFHNLSDVVALIIAFWAMWKSAENRTHVMTYGWKRTEVLGAVMNGCFLLALCLYIILEAIPKFIHPVDIVADWWFIGTAAAGMVINFVATLIFAATGTHGHSHAGGGGHGHSHGGGGHGGHGEKEKKEKHGHDHGHKEKKDKDGHGHDHGHKEKKDKDGHDHGHKEKKDKEGHDHGHKEKKEKHGHDHGHKEKKEKHGHDHGHKHVQDEDSDSHHSHEGHGPEREDMNMKAVFLHYLGDAISSLFVMVAGLLIHYLPDAAWVGYVDPGSSLLIVLLIVGSILPLLRGCSKILLQQAPSDLDCTALQEELEKVEGLRGVHDLHVWELVDAVPIASAHISVWECEMETFAKVAARCKKVLHRYGIHSSTLQPEFVLRVEENSYERCSQNCAKDCAEDWCCKDEYLLTEIVDF